MRYIVVFLTLILFSLPSDVRCQEVSIYGQRSLWYASDLCNVYFTGCDYRVGIGSGQGILGYAYHPSKKLWLITADNSGDIRHINIYSVEIASCEYTPLYKIALPRYWSSVNAANIDFEGRLYIYISEYDSLTQESTKTLSRIENYENPEITRLRVLDHDERFWELHFSGEFVYFVATKVPQIWVYNLDFHPVDTLYTNSSVQNKLIKRKAWGHFP